MTIENTTDELRKVIREELERERAEAALSPFERISAGYAASAEQREREEHDDAA